MTGKLWLLLQVGYRNAEQQQLAKWPFIKWPKPSSVKINMHPLFIVARTRNHFLLQSGGFNLTFPGLQYICMYCSCKQHRTDHSDICEIKMLWTISTPWGSLEFNIHFRIHILYEDSSKACNPTYRSRLICQQYCSYPSAKREQSKFLTF